VRTESFRVSRLSLAYLGVAQYLRSFWWFVAIIPLFGLIATIVGSGILRGMGLFALLWPFSLPARAIVATSRTGKLLERGVWASFEDGVLYLHGEEGQGSKLRLSSVRRIDQRMGFLVLVLPRGAFLALPLHAISDEFTAGLKAEVASVSRFFDVSNLNRNSENET